MEKESSSFIISEDDSGMRLDVFLARQDVALSRSQVKKLIDDDQVQVNGTVEKASCKLKTGDSVQLRKPEPRSYDVSPEAIPLRIVYEDESVVVVDKPAGMVVHPAAGNYHGTLVNALLYHCRDLSGIGGVLRPGIVHRLDKDTSGLMVVAKSDTAHWELSKQFKEHLINKSYHALVFGDMESEEGMVDSPVGRHPTDRKKMSTVSKRGKEALTKWRVSERFGMITFLAVAIETGRTHQIRVHLNAIGHPVLGDNVYGNSAKRLQAVQDTFLCSKLKGMKRQALHASQLGFFHPLTNQYLQFQSPLPEDMEQIRTFLRNHVGLS
jgi:23S rRNA pseudouridine1911/1915/1917 synthase